MGKFRKAVVVTCLFCACALNGQESQLPIQLSLIRIIANPDKFDSRLITVQGFLSMSREGDLLYIDESASENMISQDAIWVRRTEQMGKDHAKLNKTYVTVTGTFRADFKEQLGNPIGGIPNVQSVTLWSNPEHPISQRIKEIPGVSSTP